MTIIILECLVTAIIIQIVVIVVLFVSNLQQRQIYKRIAENEKQIVKNEMRIAINERLLSINDDFDEVYDHMLDTIVAADDEKRVANFRILKPLYYQLWDKTMHIGIDELNAHGKESAHAERNENDSPNLTGET
jgi:hypothetical protein